MERRREIVRFLVLMCIVIGVIRYSFNRKKFKKQLLLTTSFKSERPLLRLHTDNYHEFHPIGVRPLNKKESVEFYGGGGLVGEFQSNSNEYSFFIVFEVCGSVRNNCLFSHPYLLEVYNHQRLVSTFSLIQNNVLKKRNYILARRHGKGGGFFPVEKTTKKSKILLSLILYKHKLVEYINGVYNETMTFSKDCIKRDFLKQKIYIGCDELVCRFFTGKIYEFLVYDKALSLTTIKQTHDYLCSSWNI